MAEAIHLLGTPLDVHCLRQRRLSRTWATVCASGSAVKCPGYAWNWNAKLTEDKVPEKREDLREGIISAWLGDAVLSKLG